ncbi:MAG: peptide deformylase [Gammaproteobacteria bacterium]
MAVRRVLRMGHPVLREPASEVPRALIGGEELGRLIADMTDTLHDYGGIGLAAPQVGESLRLAIIEIAGGPTRYGDLDSVPLTVFINPSIEVLDTAVAGYWEGCLSVPGLRGYVERPQHVVINYTAENGAPERMELRGFVATVFQHEFDHLDGKLFVDRMVDMSLLVFEDEYIRFHSSP